MAQTRRKRRSKHRGTAAGTIQTRGRTGGKPRPQTGTPTGGKGGRTAVAARKVEGGPGRRNRQPSWKGAVLRAAFAALFLFALTRFGLGGKMTWENSALFAALAFAIYVPLGYYMDTFIQQRRERRLQRKG